VKRGVIDGMLAPSVEDQRAFIALGAPSTYVSQLPPTSVESVQSPRAPAARTLATRSAVEVDRVTTDRLRTPGEKPDSNGPDELPAEGCAVDVALGAGGAGAAIGMEVGAVTCTFEERNVTL
jgi:hypothetical protein